MALSTLIGELVARQGESLPAGASRRGYDRAVDALNRLPRPMLAFGTVALLAHAMLWPADFASRMAALDAVPEPLWWLMGGVTAFYFGARETHYLRNRPKPAPTATPTEAATPPVAASDNAALAEWQAQKG